MSENNVWISGIVASVVYARTAYMAGGSGSSTISEELTSLLGMDTSRTIQIGKRIRTDYENMGAEATTTPDT